MNCESRGVRNNAVVSELARTDGGTLGNTAVVTGVMQWRQDVSLTGPLSTPPPPKECILCSGGMILTGETEGLRKTCPSATLSSTNPT
jgi:hypothetical protein